MNEKQKHRAIKALEIEKSNRQQQAAAIDKVIQAITTRKYYNASILIRNFLNNSSFIWYKDINAIIDNQISNLFYDIENNTTITYDFFESQYNKQFIAIQRINDQLNELYKE